MTSFSAGCARRMTSFSSSGRPASPTPSSDRSSRKRSLYGRRMTLAIRSGGIDELVRSTGIVPPSGIRSCAVPTSQST